VAINELILPYLVSEENFPDKAFILKEAGSGDWMYVILDGRVKIKKNTSKGMLTIDTLTEGDFIGETILFKEMAAQRQYSAIAEGPVLVGSLDLERLIQEWENQPEKLRKLISTLMENLDQSIEKMVTMVERSEQP
jgi:CRP-like cAMP-binding protein